VGVPVIGRGNEVVGVVCVLDTRVRALREEDLRLLSSYAERLARALDEEEYVRERESFLRQLTTQNVELSVAKERLTSADRLKSEFMGMMSHELRTPLNIFIGYTDLLLDASDDPQASLAGSREMLDRMRELAHTLTTLVEDTLSVLRLESAGVAVNLERVGVEALFGELQATERFVHAAAGVEERWEVEGELPAIVSDRLKLRQILTNLVGNARKFTRAGTITVRAARAGAEGLALSVEDTGCGIGGADLPHIFDLYRQAANGGVHNGCGIGLYIVRRYCELLGGRVEVASEVGRGTRFTVTLPHAPAAASAPTAAAGSAPAI
jgi:signal transduction histidine kinase